MDNDIIHTFKDGERVSSTYAEIYLDDSYCAYVKPQSEVCSEDGQKPSHSHLDDESDDWISPSDLLIGILDLKPPFTSKITRGKTHEGILAIGDAVLANEYADFLKYVTELLYENDAAWNHILEHEKSLVAKKVADIYNSIFQDKSKTMQKEIAEFYESTLKELETHLNSEVENVLISSYAGIVNDLNREIKEKLNKEKIILEKILTKRYESEVKKINTYYKLLLDNELYRNNQLINKAKHKRNDALSAFYRQIEAENLTSTMYIMCTERKKCRIQQFLLENVQTTEIADKIKKIKERDDLINTLKEREKPIPEINKEWEEKVQKILQLFLKFISFTLKLLPEQTTFLLDFEKMVVLQLNEIQKQPKKVPSILQDEDKFKNMFSFAHTEPEEPVCDEEPIVVIGDLSDPIPPRYGSRETLPSDVDLPTVRLQRQFVYAKCHKYEEIKAFLESQRCKCLDIPTRPPSHTSLPTESTESIEEPSVFVESESSDEPLLPLLLKDLQLLNHCPAKKCVDRSRIISFPYLESYLDFTEENFERVKIILGKTPKDNIAPDLINPKDLIYKDLQFSATKEPTHTIGTQYSSQEDLYVPPCPCMQDFPAALDDSLCDMKPLFASLSDLLARRQVSLRTLLQNNPKLLKMVTDECFDFQM